MTDDHPHLLPDDPAKADDFGGHLRTAEALADLVRENAGGYAIALEGSWGAGKSTVIELLQDKLSATNETTVIFDAWAHQGDPLRRAFLGTLVQRLAAPTPNGSDAWVDKPTWDNELDRLAGRRKEASRTVASRVRLPAMLAALGLLCVPLGFVMLNHQLDNLESNEAGNLWFLIGFLLIGMPLLGAIIGGTIRRINEDMHAEDKASKSRFFDPIVGNESITETTTSIESPDPTSIEFEALFRKLMSEALAANERRIVIVFDNLDRVAASDALALLSTMQTFLGSNAIRDEWQARLFVLVPYDDQGLRQLWEREDRLANESNAESPSAARHVADEQLEKLFRVRLRVPPLLLADWRKYLHEQLSAALPAESEPAKKLLISVFAAHRATLNPNQLEALTPRRLKRFVNELVALRLQHPHIDLATVGYYSAQTRMFGPIDISRLSRAELVPVRVRRLLGEQVDERIAALHFGRDLADVRHMLIAEPVQRSLIDGETVNFIELAANSGIWDVFESLPFDEWLSAGGEDVGNAIATLVAARSELADPDRVDLAIAHVGGIIPPTQRFAVVTATAGSGVAHLGLHPRDDQFLIRLFQMMGDGEDQAPADSVVDRAHGLMGFIRALPSDFPLAAEASPLRLSTSPLGFVRLASLIGENQAHLPISLLTIEHEVASLDDASAELAADDSRALLRAVSVLAPKFPGFAFPELRTAIVAMSSASHPSAAIPDYTDTLLLLGSPGLDDLTQIAESHSMYHHYATLAVAGGDAQLAARVLLTQLTVNATLPAPPAVAEMLSGHAGMLACLQGSTGEEETAVRQALASVVSSQTQIEVLLKSAAASQDRLGVAEILESVIAKDTSGVLVSPDFLTANWFELVSILDPRSESVQSAVERGRAGGRFEQAAIATELAGPTASMAISLLKGPLEDGNSVRLWIQAYMSQLSSADWEVSVATGNDNVGILSALSEAKIPVDLSDYYEVALATAIEDSVVSGTAVHPRVRENAPVLLQTIEVKRRKVFLDRLATRLDANETFAGDLRQTWGPALVSQSSFRRSPGFLRVASRIASDVHVENMKWLADELDAHPDLISKAPKDDLDYFKSSVEIAISHLGDDTDSDLAQSRIRLGHIVRS